MFNPPLALFVPLVKMPLKPMLPLAWNVPSPSACGRVQEPPNEMLCEPLVQSKSCDERRRVDVEDAGERALQQPAAQEVLARHAAVGVPQVFTPSVAHVGTPSPCSRNVAVCWYEKRVDANRCCVTT